jgi:hypothetical protein
MALVRTGRQPRRYITYRLGPPHSSTLGAMMARTFQCPTCMKETHILRKGNPNLLLAILAALGSVGAWPGSCPGCVRLVHVAGSAALVTIVVFVVLELVF